MKNFKVAMTKVAKVYNDAMNIIHYMHDKYYYEKAQMALIDTNPESGQFEWGYVILDDVGFMFQEEKSLKNEYKELESINIGGALTFYIRIKNIHNYYDEISNKITVIKPINKTFYGTNEFAIMDLNGFILTFSEASE
jgi:pyruvate-formate lyase